MLRMTLDAWKPSWWLDVEDDHDVIVAGIRLVGYQHIQASVKISIIYTAVTITFLVTSVYMSTIFSAPCQ